MYNPTSKPVNYHDDNRVLRYLLHNVKGISPVSGGILGDVLENEYLSPSPDGRIGHTFDFE